MGRISPSLYRILVRLAGGYEGQYGLEKYDRKFQNASSNYLQKNVTELKHSNPGKSYSILKRMGAPPGESNDEGSFTLLNHRELNLSTEESIEHIAQYFAQISQEYPPLYFLYFIYTNKYN
jgi:hypothetical protein